MRLCPWFLALASSIPVLGLESVCSRKGCPWPWPRIFFVSLALASSLVSSTPPLLLSTMHSTVDIGDDRMSKPETVTFYNSTKFGVDVVDQMARKYTVNATSRRWPVQFFYNILDLAAINAHILYKSMVTGSKISRRRYRLRYLKSFVQSLLKREKLITHKSPLSTVTATAVSRKPTMSKSAPTKPVKHAAFALSFFVVNALKNRKNSIIVRFVASK